MSDFTISVPNESDIPRLKALSFELHDMHHKAVPEHFKTAEEILSEKEISSYLYDPQCLIYVAKSESQIVGFVTGHFCELQALVSKPIQMGSIDEIYIAEGYRHLGIAKSLFEKLETTFKQCGATQIFVEVWDFNQSALAVYEKLGFNPHIHWLRKAIN
jgi:ribosomal protein S18 acetylase RimI-like enzyme